MKLFTLKYFSATLFIFISFFTSLYDINAQTYRLTANGSGLNATKEDVVGIYVNRNIDYTGRPTYVKVNNSGPNNNISYIFYSLGFWTIYNSIQDINYWYYWTNVEQPLTLPVGVNWSNSGGSVEGTWEPYSYLNNTSNITFNNGSDFSPPIPVPNSTNNLIGRYKLIGSEIGGVLQSINIAISGIYSGVSNIKLWSSTDANFNSATDVQLSSKSIGSSVTFNAFNSLVDNSTGTYYFLTVDLAAGATGSVIPVIPSQSSFSFAGANSPSAFTNAPLSSGEVPLPIELVSFNGTASGNNITLNWSTRNEKNNLGFNVERKLENNNWETLNFIEGYGNSNSTKNYTYNDNELKSGKYQYRLKQIDIQGTSVYSNTIEVVINIPAYYMLLQNYPNPFNPSTIITYNIRKAANVILSIYDQLGNEVSVLVNEFQQPGFYSAEFQNSKYHLPSGIYFYRIITDYFTDSKKMLLLK